MALSRRPLAMRDRVKSARFKGMKSPPSAASPRRVSPLARASKSARRPSQAVMPIERSVPGAPLAQAAHGVALPIGLSRGVRRIRGVQETTILGGEQEDQPVDEAQQFLVIGLPGQLAGYERIAQIGVCRVLEEPRTEFDKGGLDAEAELFLCRRTVDPCAFAPALERAIGDASMAPNRLAWITSQSAEKSAKSPSVRIFSRLASIQAGRVRLTLSRMSRSVQPSEAIPQRASSSALRYS